MTVKEKLVLLMQAKQVGFGSWSCPWCEKVRYVCLKCGYGKRHGVCGNDDSTWMKVHEHGHKLATAEFYTNLIILLEGLNP